MSAPAPSPAPSATPPVQAADAPRPGRSILDFLTDGSLAGLCEELTTLTGVDVSLLDERGRRILRVPGQPRPWRVEEQPRLPSPLPCPRRTVGGAEGVEIDGGRWLVLMCVEGGAIGALLLEPRDGTSPSATVRAIAENAAAVAADFCRQDVDLRHRVQEIQALYRLSSMLTRATTVEAVLKTCLDSAIDVLGLAAGSIVLFENDEGPSTQTEVDLVLKASRNLSRGWLESPLPLSKDRAFDRLALRGEVVTSDDLWADERVLIEKEVRQEGLRAAIHAGLVFQDRAVGVIRLYDRRPRGFGESEKRLIKSIAHQAALAVEQARLLRLQEREGRIQRQLQLAADVQRRMLPRGVPNFPRLDVAARYVPSFELGGDFYDLIDLPDSNLGLAIGDVVGKGVAAALLMASVRSSLRAHVQDVYHIDDVLQRVNQALCRDTRDNEFATVWYGVIDREKLRLTYVAAGHDPPLIFRVPPHRRPAAADIDELATGGMALGIDPSQRYQRGTYDLQPRDLLLASTDGVTDVMNFQGKRFGRARLRQAVLDLLAVEPDAGASRVIEHVFWTLRQYAGLQERPDDQTLVVVRVK